MIRNASITSVSAYCISLIVIRVDGELFIYINYCIIYESEIDLLMIKYGHRVVFDTDGDALSWNHLNENWIWWGCEHFRGIKYFVHCFIILSSLEIRPQEIGLIDYALFPFRSRSLRNKVKSVLTTWLVSYCAVVKTEKRGRGEKRILRAG